MKKTAVKSIFMGLVLVSMLSFTGCVRYAIETPNSMVELDEESWSDYDLRATTAEGVVLAVRVLKARGRAGQLPQGDLSFWSEATQLRMRTREGYALLDQVDVQSSDGTEGIQLQFGRDQHDQPYVYWVTLFVTPRILHVIEAGGREDLFEANQDEIVEAIASYHCKR